MSIAFSDTIVALSSGRLPAGIAIVRVSGPQTRFAVETIAGTVPESRKAVLRQFRDRARLGHRHGPAYLYFPGPNSFTGEDAAEFQLHGGKAVVAALLEALVSMPDGPACGSG